MLKARASERLLIALRRRGMRASVATKGTLVPPRSCDLSLLQPKLNNEVVNPQPSSLHPHTVRNVSAAPRDMRIMRVRHAGRIDVGCQMSISLLSTVTQCPLYIGHIYVIKYTMYI